MNYVFYMLALEIQCLASKRMDASYPTFLLFNSVLDSSLRQMYMIGGKEIISEALV